MISTGFVQLDSILGGGIRSSAITDVFGAAGTGKTQLVKQIATRCILDGGSVFFVDTMGTFRPERVYEMIQNTNGDLQTLENIDVLRATSSSEQLCALEILEKKHTDLVIIDSVSDLYSFEYGRESQIFVKNLLFMEYMHKLSALALRLDVPIVITNMIRTFDGVERENLQPAIRQFAHVRIGLSKNDNSYSGNVVIPGKITGFAYTINSMGLQTHTETI